MQSRSVQDQMNIWDKIWKDETGTVVIWQTPNIPLISWVILTVISIFTNGQLSNIVWYLAIVALAIWCLLEIVRGANYFRRALGVVVALLIVAALFKVGY